MRALGIIASRARKRFNDTFNRSNQTGIGTSSDGSTWNIIRGSFNITSNKADGQTPSNYPIAEVTMPKETVSINLSGVTQGSTAALWITDSGNWLGIGIDQTTETCNCVKCATPGNCNSTNYSCNAYTQPCNGYYYACNYYYYACNAYSCDVVGNRFCRGYTTNCVAMAGPSCSRWGRYCASGWNYGNCNTTNSPCASSSWPCGSASYPCGTWTSPCNSASYPCAAYNATTYYDCNCQTCYPQYIRFIQSVANTVTQITSWTMASIVQSFKVIISNINPAKTSATATVKAYSDASLTTQVGADLTYTPTGVAINAKYGIMVKPSSYSQGTTIDEISIDTI